jgi:hypothetical protein
LFNEAEQSICSSRHYFPASTRHLPSDSWQLLPARGAAGCRRQMELQMINRSLSVSSEAPELGWAAGPEFSGVDAVILASAILGVAFLVLS